MAPSGPTAPENDDEMNLPPPIVMEGDERLGLATQIRDDTSLAHVVATDQLGFWFRRRLRTAWMHTHVGDDNDGVRSRKTPPLGGSQRE